MKKIKLIGKKGEEKWYPTYAPHIILGTNISILDFNRDWSLDIAKKRFKDSYSWIYWIFRKIKRKTQ